MLLKKLNSFSLKVFSREDGMVSYNILNDKLVDEKVLLSIDEKESASPLRKFAILGRISLSLKRALILILERKITLRDLVY